MFVPQVAALGGHFPCPHKLQVAPLAASTAALITAKGAWTWALKASEDS